MMSLTDQTPQAPGVSHAVSGKSSMPCSTVDCPYFRMSAAFMRRRLSGCLRRRLGFGLAHQPHIYCPHRDLRTRATAQFEHDVGNMSFDCPLANDQPVCDLLIGFPLSN